MEKISWTDCVRNEILHRLKAERNILQRINIKGRLTGLVTSCVRNCLLKHVTEGKIDGKLEVRKREEEYVSSYWTTLTFWHWSFTFNPLKPELNSICYLLALLAHHFLHVSRIRVKSLTFRRLMS